MGQALALSLHDLLVSHAEAAGYEECVGMITADGVVHPLRNIAPEHQRRVTFFVDPREQYEVEVCYDSDIIAVYHSHPVNEPLPSQMDLNFAANHPERLMVIVGREHDEWRVRSYTSEGQPCTFPL